VVLKCFYSLGRISEPGELSAKLVLLGCVAACGARKSTVSVVREIMGWRCGTIMDSKGYSKIKIEVGRFVVGFEFRSMRVL